MFYPFLSPRGQAIAGARHPRWDRAYAAPDGQLPSLVLDFDQGIYGVGGAVTAQPLAGARLGRPAVDGAATGLLVEPARSNMITVSRAATADWEQGGAALTDLSLSALGTFPGLVVASNGAAHHVARAPSGGFSVSTGYALTVWYRGGSANQVRMLLYDNTYAPSLFLDVQGPPGNISVVEQRHGAISVLRNDDLGGGNYRATFLFSLTDPTTSKWGFGPGSATTGEDVVILGAQVETGTAATGYIETTSGTESRAADTLTLSAAGWAGTDAGTIVLDGAAASSVDTPFAELDDGAGNRMAVYRKSDGRVAVRFSGTGAPADLITTGTIAIGAQARIGVGWDTTGVSVSLSGAPAISGAAAPMLTPDTLRFSGTGLGEIYGPALIGRLLQYTNRVSDADLAALTA